MAFDLPHRESGQPMDALSVRSIGPGLIRQTLLDGGHLIWEDAAEAYAAQLVEWVEQGYRSV
jgi:hypothetical protein